MSEQYPDCLLSGNPAVTKENSSESQNIDKMEISHSPRRQQDLERCNTSAENSFMEDKGVEKKCQPHETRVWLRCDVYDTGIGIPG